MMKKYFVIFSLVFLLFGYVCGAENREDRSIAMVGNRIIWNNDVKERAQVRAVSYEEALLQLIEEKLLIIQAKKKGIGVSREEIDNRLNFIISEWQKNGIDFVKFIRENGLTIDQYREIIAEDIQKEKLVSQISQEISGKIKISPVEIAQKMAEMPQEKQVLLLKKTFTDQAIAESFAAELKKNKDAFREMESMGWISVNKIDSTLLSDLYIAGKGNPIIKKIQEKIIVYVLAEEQENSPEERFKKAYQEIKQERFIKIYPEYIGNLAREIPVKIFDANVAGKLPFPNK